MPFKLLTGSFQSRSQKKAFKLEEMAANQNSEFTVQRMDLTTAAQAESEMFMDLNRFSSAESSVALQQLLPL